jgi:hypothetical protein
MITQITPKPPGKAAAVELPQLDRKDMEDAQHLPAQQEYG